MAKESKAQQETVGRVMHEFKQGKLESGSGDTVRNPKQAIAIALHEAGASNQQPARARKDAARTGHKAPPAGPTRAELYAQAGRRNIAGRSRMSKAQLQKALEQG